MYNFLLNKKVKIWYTSGYNTYTIKGKITKSTANLITINKNDILAVKNIVKVKIINN